MFYPASIIFVDLSLLYFIEFKLFYRLLVLTAHKEIYFMRDFLTEFHLENIQKHQQQHQELSSIAVSALQTCAADLSCTECYPPSAYNDLG